MADEEDRSDSRTSAEDARAVKRRRHDVGRELRFHIDNIRLLTANVVDAARQSETPDKADIYSRARRELMDECKKFEAAGREWDVIVHDPEDTTKDLDWRRTVHVLTNTLLDTFVAERNASFPEYGLALRYKKIKEAAAHPLPPGKVIGPVTEGTLKDLALDKSHNITFSHEIVGESSLRCSWKGLFHATILVGKFDVESIRIQAAGETEWPSQMDVFRALERQYEMSVRQLWSDSRCKTLDDVTAKLLQQMNDARNLLTAPCSETGRYFAFGPVGEKGRFAVRPPLIRTRVEGGSINSEVKASFEPALI